MMNKQIYLYLLILSVLGQCLIAQNPHPHFINYTTDDGLPDLVVYQAFQDSRGFMWFATDNGVCRFDGYEFHTHPTVFQINYASVFDFQEDDKGRIWFNTLHGELYYLQNDSIVAYENNHVVRSYQDRFSTAANFYVKNNGEVVFIELSSIGILEIQEDGSDILHDTPEKYDRGVLVMEVAPDRLLCKEVLKPVNREYLDSFFKKGVQVPLFIIGKGQDRVIENLPNLKGRSFSRSAILKTQEGHYLYYHQNLLVYITQGEVVWQTPYREEVIELMQAKDGSYHICLLGAKGIRRYHDLEALRRNEYITLLDGVTVTWMCEDSDGGVWYTTYGQGVFYTPDPELLVYDKRSGLSADLVRSISVTDDEHVFMGMQNGDVYHLATSTEKPTLLSEKQTGDFLYFILHDHQRSHIWIGKSKGMEAFDLKNQQGFNPPKYKLNRGHSISREAILSADGKTLWGYSHIDIGAIDLDARRFICSSHVVGYKVRAYSIFEDSQQNIWLGTKNGLKKWDGTKGVAIPDCPSELNGYITCMAELPDSTLLIGTRGQGLVFWKNDSVQVLNTTNELSRYDAFRKLHVEADGTIWAVTEPELKRLRKTTNGTYEIKNFTQADGLPTNVVWDIATTPDNIWIATNKGLVQMPRKESNTVSPPPTIHSIEINGEGFPLEEGLSLPYTKNSFSVDYNTLKFSQLGRVGYRYRLLPATENWSETKARHADYPSLPAEEYTFEVQSKNEDGEWSETTSFSFEINPAWWQTWWFYIFSMVGSLLTFYLFYKNRTGQLKKELTLKTQVTDLEKKALQAQMNPHFIFNCLTSIQKLILEKDADNAMRYLTRFSKLVRGTLNASVAGEVNLQEEMELLKNYIELEKLRFKDAFQYSITADPSLHLFDISFSPMLLQPYVENAIVHGMQEKKNSGQVDIVFKEEGQSVVAIITDNGPGINQTSKLNINHKSVGMSLTRRRLELMHEATEGDGLVRVEEIYDDSGMVKGTRVRVRLR